MKTQRENTTARLRAANAARKRPPPVWDWDRAIKGLKALLGGHPAS